MSQPTFAEKTAVTSGDLIPQPIFLVAAERSGTTLLRIMIDHHPQVSFAHQFEYAVDYMPETGGWPDLHQYYDALELDRIFQATRFTIDRNLDYPHLLDSFLRQQQARKGKPIVGTTVHRHFDRLLRIWPDARFIHMFRDGRDVARSYIEMGWAGNMYTAVDGWITAENLWRRMSQELAAERWTEVRYEDLVRDPEATLSKLCAFMGVPYDPAMLDYPNHSTYSAPSPSFIAQWKRKLKPRQIQLAESRIGPMLLERGYELSGYPSLRISRDQERWLRWQCRWRRMIFRRRLYGNSLYLADVISRRTGPRAWRVQVKRRIDGVIQKTLK